MRKKNFKGRCEKRSLDKFTTICKTYDPIQTAYANILVENKDISEVRCSSIYLLLLCQMRGSSL